MVRFFRYSFSHLIRRGKVTVLAFALTGGFVTGMLFAVLAGDSVTGLIDEALCAPVSPGVLLAVMLLPFLFTAFAIYTRQHWILIPVSFMKACVFSYVCGCVLQMYSETGWLMAALFLFSDCMLLPLLCWVWILGLNRRTKVVSRLIPFVFFLVSGVVFLDSRYISPYLVRLLS